jgi:hypothetical protein
MLTIQQLDDGLVLWIQAAGLLTFTVDGLSLARKSLC